MSPLRVSIVVLNYNYAGFLPSSIGGACRQDWPHCEVIVVDDASNDESRAVIAAYGEQVRTVLQPENRGHGAGINAGFAVAWGDLVIFLDADDFLRPTAARRLVENASASEPPQLLVQDTTEVDLSHHPKTKGLSQVGNERGRGL